MGTDGSLLVQNDKEAGHNIQKKDVDDAGVFRQEQNTEEKTNRKKEILYFKKSCLSSRRYIRM